MTEKEKKLEEKVFEQEVSKDELDSVTGAGSDCGKPAFMNGTCPKGAIVLQRCPDNANASIFNELKTPNATDTSFEELKELMNQNKE